MRLWLKLYHPKTLQRYNTGKADASFVDETPEITDEIPPPRADEIRSLSSDASVTSTHIGGCERGIECLISLCVCVTL